MQTLPKLERSQNGFNKSIATDVSDQPDKPNYNNSKNGCGCLFWLIVFAVVFLISWHFFQ